MIHLVYKMNNTLLSKGPFVPLTGIFDEQKQFSVLSKYVILNIFVHPPASIGIATCGLAIIS